MINDFKNKQVVSFRDKKVLIFGLGLNQGGVGAAKFFAKKGAKVKVTDLKTEEQLKDSLDELKDFDITYTLGEHKNEDVEWADLIIKNPAVKPNNPYLLYAKNQGKQIETDFGIFLEYVNQNHLIAITGTKGKTTTASLIYEALKIAGKKVILAGNIGKSILDVMPYLKDNPFVIAEISSFQLQSLESSKLKPKIAIITNIYPDHLNWHSSMEEYIQAKRLIAADQTEKDCLLLHEEDGILNEREFLNGIKSQIKFFCHKNLDEKYEDLPLKGGANKDNYSAALEVCKILGVDKGIAFKAFKNFKGAPFRLEFMGTFKRISIINDSAATNPKSTIEALKLYPKCILITGGMNKGLDYKELAAAIAANTKSVFFLEGDATNELLRSLRLQRGNLSVRDPYKDLERLLNDVKQQTKPGDVVLFSPGATSFNLFQNEFDRGRRFNEAVRKVFR